MSDDVYRLHPTSIEEIVEATERLIDKAKRDGLEYLKVEKLGLEFKFSGPALRLPRPRRDPSTEAVYPDAPTLDPPETDS